ncbi:response regulator [Catenovulum sediminis]|uniref:Response regulator n=1 Tax=Catenovulum sediminis TaxID=1740262 RepID=A0ABV1RNM6_9ALTE
MSKILVLDDDPQILKMVSLILKKRGHHILTAENGSHALQTIESQQIEVLLTDILMPDVDGIEVINTCRKKALPVKIIAMSGGRRKISAEFNLQSAAMLGASEILPKPFTQEQLVEKIELVTSC